MAWLDKQDKESCGQIKEATFKIWHNLCLVNYVANQILIKIIFVFKVAENTPNKFLVLVRFIFPCYKFRASSFYFFLFFSAYSYFSFFFFSNFLLFFLFFSHFTCNLYFIYFFSGISFQPFIFLSGTHQLFLKIFQPPYFLWHYFVHI